MVRSEYKLGEWLINRHTKQLVEVIEIFEIQDLEQVLVVKYIDSPYYRSESKTISKINKLYAKAKSAQLLYSNNIQRR